ncbi:MAG: hypothetical protein K0Q73_6075, partial [Paenibacillus sp.]|nr:hypothetical protein [Paenibacillus sp.]
MGAAFIILLCQRRAELRSARRRRSRFAPGRPSAPLRHNRTRQEEGQPEQRDCAEAGPQGQYRYERAGDKRSDRHAELHDQLEVGEVGHFRLMLAGFLHHHRLRGHFAHCEHEARPALSDDKQPIRFDEAVRECAQQHADQSCGINSHRAVPFHQLADERQRQRGDDPGGDDEI